MQKNILIAVVLITLVFGFSIGYTMGQNEASRQQIATNNSAKHTMPDGSMMGNSEQNLGMADMMSSMNGGLQGKTGDEFDKAFISGMIIHHQGAIEMAQLALTNGNRQEIKDLAKAIISAQNKEIGDMKTWQKTWYNQ